MKEGTKTNVKVWNGIRNLFLYMLLTFFFRFLSGISMYVSWEVYTYRVEVYIYLLTNTILH